ncbi:MAG: hypothetical protein VW127_02910 [Flavobacteriaceae bacterium]
MAFLAPMLKGIQHMVGIDHVEETRKGLTCFAKRIGVFFLQRPEMVSF